MIKFSHLRHIFKNICAGKKSLREILKCVYFEKDRLTATNSFVMYQYKTDVPEHLREKLLKPDSHALSNEGLFSLALLPEYAEKEVLLSFNDDQYPQYQTAMPDISKDHISVKLNKKYLENLLSAFESETVLLYVNTSLVNSPVTVTSEEENPEEYGLIMSIKKF